MEMLFTILPLLIIPCLFFYDYFLYNGIITKVFYYLPFYFIYTIWKNSSSFLHNTNISFNNVIYERYYKDDVLYINTTKAEESILATYLRFKLVLLNTDTLEFIQKFKHYRRFIHLKDSYFINASTKEIVDINNSISSYILTENDINKT